MLGEEITKNKLSIFLFRQDGFDYYRWRNRYYKVGKPWEKAIPVDIKERSTEETHVQQQTFWK